MYKKVPTYKDGKWDYKEFETKEDFTEYITILFKEPGQYDFDETALLFNKAGYLSQIKCLNPPNI